MSIVETLFGAGTPTAASTELTVDDALSLLSNSRRREVIKLVAADGGPQPLNSLATEIARQENGHESTFDVTDKERKRVYISLHQAHLDDLADAGAIRRDQKKIRPGPNASALAELLAVIDERVGA